MVVHICEQGPPKGDMTCRVAIKLRLEAASRASTVASGKAAVYNEVQRWSRPMVSMRTRPGMDGA